MRVGICQMNMKLDDIDYNLHHLEDIFNVNLLNKDVDVVVLPETWNLGYFPKQKLKEKSRVSGKKALLLSQKLALSYGVNFISGSIITEANDKVYNRSYIIDCNGEVVGQYDKIHLFTYMNEDKYFEFGDHIEIFEINGIKCGVIICYDLRFVELVRSIALKNISILFVVAQWPIERVEHWKILNCARAIENQIYVVAVNSCAQNGNIKFGGHSLVVDPQGKIIYQAGTEEKVDIVDLDLSVIDKIKNGINIYKDRREDVYSVVVGD